MSSLRIQNYRLPTSLIALSLTSHLSSVSTSVVVRFSLKRKLEILYVSQQTLKYNNQLTNVRRMCSITNIIVIKIKIKPCSDSSLYTLPPQVETATRSPDLWRSRKIVFFRRSGFVSHLGCHGNGRVVNSGRCVLPVGAVS